MTTVIKSWKAKRAGGRITIYGRTEAGADTKVVGVDSITTDGPVDCPYVVAIDKSGARYRLDI